MKFGNLKITKITKIQRKLICQVIWNDGSEERGREIW